MAEQTDAWRPPEHLARVFHLFEGSDTIEAKVSMADGELPAAAAAGGWGGAP